MNVTYPRFKSFVDLPLALVSIALLSPLLLVIAFLVWACFGSPVLFVQCRPGFRGRPFYLFKFRTMTFASDSNGGLLSDTHRLPSFGRFLRSTSLDELPGLVNVLRGEMSFIGPRPLLMEYLPLYSVEQARRHDVMPGFSGWAQINGRNSLPWDEKFRLDVWYVDHQSFLLDLRIFLTTIWKVISRDGISASGEVTIAPFTGSATEAR